MLAILICGVVGHNMSVAYAAGAVILLKVLGLNQVIDVLGDKGITWGIILLTAAIFRAYCHREDYLGGYPALLPESSRHCFLDCRCRCGNFWLSGSRLYESLARGGYSLDYRYYDRCILLSGHSSRAINRLWSSVCGNDHLAEIVLKIWI